MTSKESARSALSALPQVERLLSEPAVARWFAALSRPLVARLASETLTEMRRRLLAGEPFPGPEAVIAAVAY